MILIVPEKEDEVLNSLSVDLDKKKKKKPVGSKKAGNKKTEKEIVSKEVLC